MRSMRAGFTVACAVLLIASSFPVCAGESKLSPGAAFQDSGMRENPQLRRMIVEEAIAQSSSEIRFAHTLSEVLKDQSGSALLVTARDAADFHVNPEPSSLLVWTAMGISLLAAGYAYRRRVENETSTFATA